MAQSKVTRQGQRKGKNVPIGDAPPVLVSSGSASIPSIGRGAATATSNVQGKQTVDPKYPLWKYVTREGGAGKKGGGGNCSWKCNFFHGKFTCTYFRVKAHLLGIPGCGIKCCTTFESPKRKELEKEQGIGEANVAAKLKKKNKNDDPLPFLRKSSNKFHSKTFSRGESAKRKATSVGPMDKIFQKEKKE